jgi:hypothetical protein
MTMTKILNGWIRKMSSIFIVILILVILYSVISAFIYPIMWNKNIEYFTYFGFYLSIVGIWIGLFISGKIENIKKVSKRNLNLNVIINRLADYETGLNRSIQASVYNHETLALCKKIDVLLTQMKKEQLISADFLDEIKKYKLKDMNPKNISALFSSIAALIEMSKSELEKYNMELL